MTIFREANSLDGKPGPVSLRRVMAAFLALSGVRGLGCFLNDDRIDVAGNRYGPRGADWGRPCAPVFHHMVGCRIARQGGQRCAIKKGVRDG